MKKAVLSIIIVLWWISSIAQVPESFNYQVIVRDVSNNPITNQNVSFRMSILKGSISGSSVYSELHSATTNGLGLVTLAIGNGTGKTGDFTAIDWGADKYFLKVEIDPAGGISYVEMGTTQLISVPYAVYSKTAVTAKDAVKITGDQTITGDKTFNNKIIVTQQGIGTATPNASSALEISSTTQGFLPPRMTQAQRDAITAVEGLVVYNTTTKIPNYYNGTEWRNYDCTPAKIPAIGDPYRGGIIAYILQSGDPGYVAGESHGLIAAPSDQSISAEWGCYGTPISGADGIAIGTGKQNTIDIVTGCTTAGIAAKLCYDLKLNGYHDWYLPSKDELNKLYINKAAIGGFDVYCYWSSTEGSINSAWVQDFTTGFQSSNSPPITFKSCSNYVRAVRAF